jgi:glycosyltransferase involved in cell wall biosynthesis
MNLLKEHPILLLADRLPPLIGGMEVHAGAFIHYFKSHLRFPLKAIISKDPHGHNILLKENGVEPISFKTFSKTINPSLIFFNSGRWIEEMESLRSYFPCAQFIYRTGGNEILKAPLEKRNIGEHAERQHYWVKTLNTTLDRLITNSHFTTKRLRDVGIACPMTLCVGGVDIALLKEPLFFNNHGVNPLVNHAVKLFCAARFVPYKNHALLISVVHALRLRGHNIHLILAGDGPLLNKIQEDVRIKELEKNVTFLGPLTNEDVLKTMLESHFYIQLSTDYPTEVPGGTYLHSEGMGRSFLEAISGGIFVIAANSGAISEIVTKERGLLVDLDHFEDLVLSIENLLQTPPHTPSPIDTYSWENLFKGYERLFGNLIKGLL